MSEPLTITAAAPLLRTGRLTPSELLEQCLARVDVYEPAVKAWVYLDRERARREAEVATKEIQSGEYRGELHGIPVGIKDIIDVFDMPTGCGSKLWANSYARQDATCVRRLRQAGAIILGKTVTTPYAFTDPPVTRNPWNLERTPGGSSSGSAAAVACGMCLAALGTQTGGSLTRPASYCGVCSLKPTYGRVSMDGVLPLSTGLDHVGAMANCVRDLVILFQAIYHDREQTYSGLSPDFLRVYDQEWHDSDFGFVGGLFHDLAEPCMRDLLATIRAPLLGMGKHLDSGHDFVLPPMYRDVLERHYEMMAKGAAWEHRERLERHPEDYPPNITKLIRDGLQMMDVNSVEAHMHHVYFPEEMMKWTYSHGPSLLTPAAPGPAPTPETTGPAVMNSPWSYARLPTISLPAGWHDGLPLGVQLVGSWSGESRLFNHAFVLEHKLRESEMFAHRLPPVPAAVV